MPYYSKQRRLRIPPGMPALPARHWQCFTGQPSTQDQLCPPMRANLGAPEIQHCGYKNADRRACWSNVVANFELGMSVGSPAPELGPGECVTHDTPTPHTHCGPLSSGEPPAAIDDPMTPQNLYEIAQYADRTLASIQRHPCPLPAWARHKLSQARTQLGDVAHFVQYHEATHAGENAMSPTNRGKFYGTQNPVRRRTARELASLAESNRAGAPAGASIGRRVRTASAFGRRDQAQEGSTSRPGITGYRTAGFGGVTSAAAKSAMAVRRYNLMARAREAAGMSIGAPISTAQANAMQGVLAEHGYAAGMQATGVRPRLNNNWPHDDRAYGYPQTPASGGVFYGSQNPVRAGERRRESPSGWQNGFAVGGEGSGGCGCGCG